MRVLVALPIVVAAACTKPVEPAPTTVAVAAQEAAHSCGGHQEPDDEDVASLPMGLKPGDEATCVVMNRKFVLTETTPVSIFEGKAYPFCCDGCKDMFDKDPAKYAQLAMK